MSIFIKPGFWDERKLAPKHWLNLTQLITSIVETLIPPTPTASYKVYTALLTQSSTNPPTPVVLENTLGVVTFGYVSTGVYTINSTELQKPKNKVTFLVNQSKHTVGTIHFVNQYVTILKNLSGNNVVNLTLQNLEHRMNASDGSFVNFAKINDIAETQEVMIEIRVYN